MHVFSSSLSNKSLDFVGQHFNRDKKFKTCEYLKDELSLTTKNLNSFK